MATHPLDRWLDSLQPLEAHGVRAWRAGDEEYPWAKARRADSAITPRIRPLRRSDLFSVNFAVYGFLSSWMFNLKATTFTEDYALFTSWQEADERPATEPRVVGLLDRRELFRSAALLALHSENDYDRFSGEHPLWDELTVSALDGPDLYRLLLAYCGRGSVDLLARSDDEIRRYREPGMEAAFEDVMKLRKSRHTLPRSRTIDHRGARR